MPIHSSTQKAVITMEFVLLFLLLFGMSSPPVGYICPPITFGGIKQVGLVSSSWSYNPWNFHVCHHLSVLCFYFPLTGAICHQETAAIWIPTPPAHFCFLFASRACLYVSLSSSKIYSACFCLSENICIQDITALVYSVFSKLCMGLERWPSC